MSIKWPNLGLFGEFVPCEDGILEKINDNFEILDTVSQMSVLGFVANQASLPGTASTGDVYIAQDDGTAYLYTDSWQAITPSQGWLAYDTNSSQFYVFDGTNWVTIASQINPDVENIGSATAIGTFIQKNPTTGTLEFRKIRSDSGIDVTEDNGDIVLNTNLSLATGLPKIASYTANVGQTVGVGVIIPVEFDNEIDQDTHVVGSLNVNGNYDSWTVNEDGKFAILINNKYTSLGNSGSNAAFQTTRLTINGTNTRESINEVDVIFPNTDPASTSDTMTVLWYGELSVNDVISTQTAHTYPTSQFIENSAERVNIQIIKLGDI